MKLYAIIIIYACFSSIISYAQKQIPANRVLPIDELATFIKPLDDSPSFTTERLANHFRNVFADRFFFNFKNVDERFKTYAQLYHKKDSHQERAMDHMQKFNADTPWQLPFNYLNGEEVNAYALRHLARQHKMIDVAYMYFYSNKDTTYLDYFTNQVASLNRAFAANKVETMESGNGVFEAFRAGYRVLNWLQIHSMFLGENEYSNEEQLETVATLLQHGASLYENNAKFKSGNHQTRGVSALAMLSIIFSDVEGTDLWYNRAMKRLSEHLDNEINKDGFQFERSVHYHMSDIGNYFYVYQLAKISGLNIDPVWEQKLKTLFTTLVKVAYPDKSAPVLQDDTDDPWAEKNDISGVMTLGYVLFEDPEFGYFAKEQVAAKMYWFLKKEQLNALNTIATQPPTYKSLYFPETAYYITREGWHADAKMMVISAGVDDKKPDHQHGDMLGIQAMANDHVVLPNYQVRYSLPDFDFFKNSMVKNVALVDDELIGKAWKGNKGGSGFGKFKNLPKPKVISWKSNPDFDVFVGSHDGFENVGVNYSRQVIYVKDDFWIVKDNFASAEAHTYKQVWQGHYSLEEAPKLLRATFEDASGFDIYQLQEVDKVLTDGKRGKSWAVISSAKKQKHQFISILFPYRGYSNRIDEVKEVPDLKGWQQNAATCKLSANAISLSKNEQHYFFNTNSIIKESLSIGLDNLADVYVNENNGNINLNLLSAVPVSLSYKGAKLQSQNGVKVAKTNKVTLQPGDRLVFKID